MQHYIILLRAIISSLYFNFKYLPFNQALKLPILLYKPYFKELKGKVVIDSSNIYFGMIRMGFWSTLQYPNSGIAWENQGGTVVFKGNCMIGNAASISIGRKAYIEFGENFKNNAAMKLISVRSVISQIPHNGGSRKDLGESQQLKCHQKENIGFNDVYGRLRWDDCSTTITGGCLNPSKGRFLHPEQNRCISAREASLLQTFPPNYIFPANIPRTKLALMIGNALPPDFSKIQALNLKRHIIEHLNNIQAI